MRKFIDYCNKKYKIIIVLFFLGFLLIGLFIYKDYGISWDEDISRTKGDVSIDYISNANQGLLTSAGRYYGPVYDMLLVGIEKVFKLSGDIRNVYLMRHLVNFLLFYLSVICFYFLCKKSFKNWKIGLLGSIFLILSPRIFADAFYNPKDLPLMSFFIISIYTMILFLEKKTAASAIIHALVCAITVDIRIVGIIIPFFTLVFFVLDLLLKKEIVLKGKKIILNFFIYIFLFAGFTILLWPYLWSGPISHFLESLKLMSRFPFKGYPLFMGFYIPATGVPWHFIPVWIIITTPILYITFFTIGIYSFVVNFFRNPKKYYLEKKKLIIFVLWFFLPLIIVIILKSALYNGWRQMYFVYPALILLSIEGIIFLFNFIKGRFKEKISRILNIILIVIIFSGTVNTAYFMIKNHPFENLYFNIIAGSDISEAKYDFEMDYWGLTYRKALEYILKNDPGKSIKFSADDQPGWKNLYLIPEKDRNRLVFVENPDSAKYFICNFKYHRNDYLYTNEFYSIKINGIKILIIYKVE